MANPKPLLVVPGKNIHLKPQEQEVAPDPQPIRIVCPSCGSTREIIPKKSRFEMRCQAREGCGAKLRVDISNAISGPDGESAVIVTILKGRPSGLSIVGDGT